jgi:hypothetical protein
MEMSTQAREIVRQLIRNRFDALKKEEILTTGAMLIAIAREIGFARLADEMRYDLEAEMPSEMRPYLKRFAA